MQRKWMRQKGKAILTSVGAVILSLGMVAGAGMNAKAADATETESNNSAATANSIALNQEITGSIASADDVDWYKFTLTEPGAVSFDCSHDDGGVSYYSYWKISLLSSADAVADTIYTTTLSGGTKEVVRSYVYNLPAGTYYIKASGVSSTYWASYAYYVTVNFESASGKDWEKESNDTPDTANVIVTGKEYMGRTSQGDADWYQFTISEPGTVSLDYYHDDSGASYYNYWKYGLYSSADEINGKIYSFDVAGGVKSPARTVVHNLPAGTYYVKVSEVSSSNYSRDAYYLIVNYQSATGKNWETENNDTADTADTVVAGTEYTGNIKAVDDADWYKFTLAEPTELAVDFSHEKFSADYYRILKYAIYSSADEAADLITNVDVYGGEKVLTRSDAVEVPAGTYYLKVTGYNSGNWSNLPYYLTVKATPLNLDCKWLTFKGKSYWYEGNVRQGTVNDAKGVFGDGTNRGREICDMSLTDDAGQAGVWFWLDSIYDGAKATGKEVWMPYIYQNEAEWSDEEIERIAAESDFGMEGMGRCVRDAIKSKAGKWVRYDNNGRMLKGWVTISGDLAKVYPDQKGNKYYYDTRTGLMAKGWVKIDGKDYYFDETTGVLQK